MENLRIIILCSLAIQIVSVLFIHVARHWLNLVLKKNGNYTRRKLSHTTNEGIIADSIRSLTSHVPGLQNTKSKWSWGGTAGKILQPSSSGWEPILLPIPPDWNLLHMVHTSYYQLYFLAPITNQNQMVTIIIKHLMIKMYAMKNIKSGQNKQIL